MANLRILFSPLTLLHMHYFTKFHTQEKGKSKFTQTHILNIIQLIDETCLWFAGGFVVHNPNKLYGLM